MLKNGIASGYATSLFRGDPVKLLTSGTLDRCAAGVARLGLSRASFYRPPSAGRAHRKLLAV